jgi:hypothetical protein
MLPVGIYDRTLNALNVLHKFEIWLLHRFGSCTSPLAAARVTTLASARWPHCSARIREQ